VTIVLTTLAVLNLPVMIYALVLHVLMFGEDGLFLVPMLVIDAAIILITLVVLYGANEFRRLGNRNAAWTAVILACIPFCSPCLVLGIPIGIWGLTMLGRTEVREAFKS
jgi:hypothetical protein